jgi:hypothetical protein
LEIGDTDASPVIEIVPAEDPVPRKTPAPAPEREPEEVEAPA